MRRRDWLLLGVVIGLLGVAVGRSFAQAVVVTMSLDTNRIAIAESTTLRVFAQVVPSLSGSNQVFSWYVDLLNANGDAAVLNYAAMLKLASDNDPETSSMGTPKGAHRRGIYDTFFHRPDAGLSRPVELMAIPVVGAAPGVARFLVQAGTDVAGLFSDFVVASNTSDELFFGGDYTRAFANLTVETNRPCLVGLNIAPATPGASSADVLVLSFVPCPGYNHTVEFSDTLGAGSWQPLPAATHNSGRVEVVIHKSRGFHRVRVTAGPVAPSVRVKPLSVTTNAGAAVFFLAEATGTLPLSYQWWFNGAKLTKATNASLVIPSVQAANAGNYQAVVTNATATATSTPPAHLTVLGASPYTLTQPGNPVATVATSTTFGAVASGAEGNR